MMNFAVKESVFCFLFVFGFSEQCGAPGPDYIAHYQNLFCDAKYVLVGKVESTDEVPNSIPPIRRYKVRVQGVVRGFRWSDIGTVQDIYTPESGASCGVTLDVGSTYALGANKNNEGRYYMTLLNFYAEYSKMTVQQQMYMWLIRGRLSYSANCRCRISRDASNRTCLLKSNENCYKDKAICSYNRRTRTCEWVNADTCFDNKS